MPAIIAVILGAIGKFLTDKLLMYVAIKALIITLFVVVLPIILQNVVVWIFTEIFTFIQGQIPSGTLEDFTISLSGVGAYLAGCFQLPLCISILISAIALRITLNFIPFIK